MFSGIDHPGCAAQKAHNTFTLRIYLYITTVHSVRRETNKCTKQVLVLNDGIDEQLGSSINTSLYFLYTKTLTGLL